MEPQLLRSLREIAVTAVEDRPEIMSLELKARILAENAAIHHLLDECRKAVVQ